MIARGLVLGGNLYADVAETRHDNRLSRVSLGVELLSDWVDFHANWYDVPSGPKMIGQYAEQTRTVRSETTASTRVTGQSVTNPTLRPGSKQPVGAPHYDWNRLDPHPTDPSRLLLTGTSTSTYSGRFDWSATTHYAATYTTRTTTTTITDWFESFEGAGDGLDAEVGFRVPWPGGPEFRVYGGWYSFKDPFGPDMEGWKARAEFRPGPWLTLEGGLYEDDRLTGSDWFVGARVSIPLTRDLTWADVREGLFGGRARTLHERMGSESPARDALRARESGWIENPDRKQVEKKVEESSRTEHYSETTPMTGTGLLPPEVKSEEMPVTTPSQMSHTVNGEMQLTTPGGGTQTVQVTVGQPTIQDALKTGATTVYLPGGTYDERVTIASGQTLTGNVSMTITDAGGATVGVLSSSGTPTISSAVSGGAVVTMEAGSKLERVNVTNTANATNSHGIRVLPGAGETLISDSVVTAGNGWNSHGVGVSEWGNTFGDLRITGSTITANGGNFTSGVWVYSGLGGADGPADRGEHQHRRPRQRRVGQPR